MATPAFTWRTLAWLNTSLLKGMSRETLSAILGLAFVMVVLHGGQPRASLSIFSPPPRLTTSLFL
jgi:hypothetical protein